MYSETKLIGRVGQTEVKDTKNGKKFANVSIATTHAWQDNETNEWKEHTEWHNCIVFNENIVKRISDSTYKGRTVLAIGENQTTKYRKDGEDNDRFNTTIRLSKLRLLDTVKKDDETAPEETTA